jgi:hypothetical protein
MTRSGPLKKGTPNPRFWEWMMRLPTDWTA